MTFTTVSIRRRLIRRLNAGFPLTSILSLGAIWYPQIRAESPGQNEGNRPPRGALERIGSRQSGAEDPALQTLARKTRRPLGRASVWSARVFTAAFPTRPTPASRANACPTVTIPWRFLNEPPIFVGNGQPRGRGQGEGEESPRKPNWVMKSPRRGTERITRDAMMERGCRGNSERRSEAGALSAPDFMPPVSPEVCDSDSRSRIPNYSVEPPE